jgi:hypothetical protein
MMIVGRPQERTVAERLARRPQELVLPAKLVIIPVLASKMVLLPAFLLMSLALVEAIAALVLVVAAVRAE